MRRRSLWISFALAFFGLPLFIYFGLRLGFATPLVNLGLKKELGGLFNGEVRFGSFRTDLFSYAEINDLLVLARHGEARLPVLTAGRIRLNYDGWKLVTGQRSLEDSVQLLRISSLRVFLLRDKGGRWNLREVFRLPGGKKRVKKEGGGMGKLPALATRLVLEDSIVVFNDERRGFQSTVENVEGTLDARAFPLVAFSLSGRTEDQAKDNLSIAGEWNASEESIYARADLDVVPLKTYLNYALPAGGLQFLGGSASLSVRVRQAGREDEIDFAGRANVIDGSLAIPGITEPLESFRGEVLFGDDSFKVNGVTATFLGSTWRAQGELTGMRSPHLNLVLENPVVALSPLSEQIRGLKALSLSGTAALSLTMTGKAVDPVIHGTLTALNMELAGISLGDVRAGIKLTKSTLQVDSLSGRLWSGAVQGSAEIGFPDSKSGNAQGNIDAQLSAEGVDLSQIRYRGIEYLPITGTARLSASVKGALLRPQVEAELSAPFAYFSATPMGVFELKARVEGKDLDLSLLTWQKRFDAHVSFNFDSAAIFVDSKVRLHKFPLNELMLAISRSHDTALISPAVRSKMTLQAQRYAGTADMELALSGPVRSPDLSLLIISHEGRLLMPPGFWKARHPQGLAFGVRGLLRLGAAGLNFGEGVEPFKIILGGKSPVEARLFGSLPVRASQNADPDGLDIKLNADLGALDELEIFKKTKGSAEMDLRLTGQIDSLLASGWLQFKDVSTEMGRYLSKVKNGEAQIWIKDQSLTVENVSFESGGLFEASGHLNFSQGLRPLGIIEARTDAEGLTLDNLDYGDLHVALLPLKLSFLGNEGMNISGKAVLHDSVVRLPKPKPAAERVRSASAPYPLSFDLGAEIDENVWLKKEHEGIEFSDPLTMLQNLLSSAQETMQSPAFEFLFKPTERDFVVRGTPPDLQMIGELGIDRGSMIFMENEFKIRQETKANRIVFRNLERIRADVEAVAVAQIRYVSELPGGRIEPRTVRVTVNIVPFTEEELIEARLENALLNYNLKEFKSEPPLSDNPSREREAILSLLVLGDPLNQNTRDAVGGPGQPGSSDQDARLLSIQASRLIGGELRKVINRYAKFIGGPVVDYVRVAPRVRYRSGGAAPTPAASSAVSQQIQQEGFRLSWLFELGRSIGRDVYTSLQVVLFGDDDINAAKTQNTGPVLKEVRERGARIGAEYRFAPTRMAEISYGYSVDENLDPVAFSPDNILEAHRYYIGLRNTIPTENYNARESRRRHQAEQERRETEQ